MSPDAMLASLTRHWEYPKYADKKLAGCEAIRVQNLKEEFILDYEMTFAPNGKGENETVAFIGQYAGKRAETQYRETIESLKKEKRKQLSRKTPPGLISCFPDLGLVFRIAGIDERINGLKHIFRPRALPVLLSKVLPPEYGRITKCRTEILGHRLGKRCVVRYRYKTLEGKPGSVIGKIYKSPELGRNVYLLMKGLWTNGFAKDAEDQIFIPKPLGYVHDLQLIIMEDVSGASLRDLGNVPIDRVIQAAGRALAKLHRTSLRPSKEHSVDDEIEILKHNVKMTSLIYPELESVLTMALGKTLEALDGCRNFNPTLVHRDFHERQVLFHKGRSILLDFDTLCTSDPALDVGNYLAHLDLLEMQGIGTSKRLRQIFLAAYDVLAQENFQSRVEVYTKASFLRLACQYPLQSPWRHLTKAFIKALE